MKIKYNYKLAEGFAKKRDEIYNNYKHSNNYQFYSELSQLIEELPIHVLTDFDNTFAISTEYKLGWIFIKSAFKKKNIIGGIKEFYKLIEMYIKYKLGKDNLNVILKNLFDKDISQESIKNIIYNTTFKNKCFQLLLKLKEKKGVNQLNIVVLSRNSIDLVNKWIEHNRVMLNKFGLQIVGAIANKIVYIEEYNANVVLNPIVDTYTKIKIFPDKGNDGEKIIWISDSSEQSQTKRIKKVKSYFV